MWCFATVFFRRCHLDGLVRNNLWQRPNGPFIDVIAEAENVLTVDMLYTEYLTTSINFLAQTWIRHDDLQRHEPRN